MIPPDTTTFAACVGKEAGSTVWELQALGGAMTAVPSDATATANLQSGSQIVIMRATSKDQAAAEEGLALVSVAYLCSLPSLCLYIPSGVSLLQAIQYYVVVTSTLCLFQPLFARKDLALAVAGSSYIAYGTARCHAVFFLHTRLLLQYRSCRNWHPPLQATTRHMW